MKSQTKIDLFPYIVSLLNRKRDLTYAIDELVKDLRLLLKTKGYIRIKNLKKLIDQSISLGEDLGIFTCQYEDTEAGDSEIDERPRTKRKVEKKKSRQPVSLKRRKKRK